MQKQDGKDILLYIDTVTAITEDAGTPANYRIVACLTSNGFSFSRDPLTDTRTKCDGGDPVPEPGNKSWSFSGDGVITTLETSEEATHLTNQELLELANTGKKFWAKTANTVSGEIRESVVWIDSYDETAPEDGKATFTTNLTGYNKLNTDVVPEA